MAIVASTEIDGSVGPDIFVRLAELPGDEDRTCRSCRHWSEREGQGAGVCDVLDDDDRIEFDDYRTYAEARFVTRGDFGCISWDRLLSTTEP